MVRRATSRPSCRQAHASRSVGTPTDGSTWPACTLRPSPIASSAKFDLPVDGRLAGRGPRGDRGDPHRGHRRHRADATIQPHAPGFTALTGETGAGKTMVLTGLALLLGGRADAVRVRGYGSEPRSRAACASTAGNEVVLARLADAADDLDERGCLVLARWVSAGVAAARGSPRLDPCRHRCSPTSPTTSSPVHGQSDQQRLPHPALPRADSTASAEPSRWLNARGPGAAFDRWRALELELADLTEHARERAQEADRLRHGLAEVEFGRPRPVGEWEVAQSAERSRLAVRRAAA